MGAGEPVEKRVGAADRLSRVSPYLSFISGGLAPLVGLLLVFVTALGPFAFGEIEGAAQSAARRVIEEGGYGWARANVSGQWVSLEGEPPSRDAADRLIAAIASATAPAFLGEARPVGRLIEEFTWADRAGGVPQPNVQVTAKPVAPTPAASSGASPCDGLMPERGGLPTIEFPSNSDRIDPASALLLDRIAREARDCSARLRIEGHTDGVGREGANLSLSRRRAEAVRAALISRGVPADRLEAEGFGDARPVADNRVEHGRARNRRIEIRPISALPD